MLTALTFLLPSVPCCLQACEGHRVCILPARICSSLAVHSGIVQLIPASKDAQGNQAAFYSGATRSLVHLGERRPAMGW